MYVLQLLSYTSSIDVYMCMTRVTCCDMVDPFPIEAVQGTGLKLRKPKKGECPGGQDAEDDPRYSSLAKRPIFVVTGHIFFCLKQSFQKKRC